MVFLSRGGLAMLGLAACAVVAPAQTYVQTPMTQVEVTQSPEPKVRAPFFRFFSSSPTTKTTTTRTTTTRTTMSQTAEPPLRPQAEFYQEQAPFTQPVPTQVPPSTSSPALRGRSTRCSTADPIRVPDISPCPAVTRRCRQCPVGHLWPYNRFRCRSNRCNLRPFSTLDSSGCPTAHRCPCNPNRNRCSLSSWLGPQHPLTWILPTPSNRCRASIRC